MANIKKTKLIENYLAKTPLLSLCIPTKNRNKEFKNLLTQIKDQLSLDLEIVVRDDSHDNKSLENFKNYLTLNKFKFQYQYFQGQANGLDRANLFLLEKARGKYVWWCGDDDLIINDGIKSIISLVKEKPDLSFIWVNFAQNTLNNLACDCESRYFENVEDLLLTLDHKVGLLSTHIVKRKDGLKFIDDGYAQVKGFSFVTTTIVLAIVANNYKSYLLKGPYLMNIPSSIEDLKKMMYKNGEYQNGAFTTYGVYYKEVIDTQKHLMSRIAYIKILSLIFNPVWKGIYVAWLGGWDNPNGKRLRMFRLYWFLPQCWFALILYAIPKSINQQFYKIYKLLK